MKNFIFFRTDRLGDFLIITNIIKVLKEKYPKSKITVVASQLNYLFIKKYKIIDRVILYNKNYNFLKKIQIFKIINDRNYDASFSVDGKSLSNLCTFFLKSKLKLGLIYKSKIFGFPFSCEQIPDFSSQGHGGVLGIDPENVHSPEDKGKHGDGQISRNNISRDSHRASGLAGFDHGREGISSDGIDSSGP